MMRVTLIATACIAALCGCVAPGVQSNPTDATREDIYVLRSIRERLAIESNWCSATRIGFEPMPVDAERFYSFWSVETQQQTGRLTESGSRRVAELRACFGATSERVRQNFYAEIRLGEISFHGVGECVALLANVPEQDLYSVRCHLVLRDLPAPYRAGLLTTNTLTSRAAFGGVTDPPGYTQASIATIRLWRDPLTPTTSTQPAHGESDEQSR